MELRFDFADERALFTESNCHLLVEVRPENCAAFELHFDELKSQVRRVGTVTQDNRLSVAIDDGAARISVSVNELVAAWNGNG
jgi:hypothetical protein